MLTTLETLKTERTCKTRSNVLRDLVADAEVELEFSTAPILERQEMLKVLQVLRGQKAKWGMLTEMAKRMTADAIDRLP